MESDIYFWLFVLWYSSFFVFGWSLTVRKSWIRKCIGTLAIIFNFVWGLGLMPVFFKLSATYRRLDGMDCIKNPDDSLFYAIFSTMYLLFVFAPVFAMGYWLRKNGKVFGELQSSLESQPESCAIGKKSGCPDLMSKDEPQQLDTGENKKQQAPKVSLKQTLKNLHQKQKVFLGLAAVACLLLLLPWVGVLATGRWPEFPHGFYTFLRIVTCAALVGLLLENLSMKWKLPLLLLAILYNPVIPIRLDGQDVLWFIVTVPMLAVPWIILLRRLHRKDAAPDQKEVS